MYPSTLTTHKSMNFFKLTFLTLSFFYASKLSAQLEKGNIQLGAEGVADFIIGDRFPVQNWRLMPEASYFLLDKLSLGLSGLYREYSANDFGSGNTFHSKTYNVGLLSRYYLYQKDAFSFYVENYMGLGENIGNSEIQEEFNFRTGIFRLGIGAGISYHFIPNAALNLSYRYNRDFVLNDANEINRPSGDFRLGLKVNFTASK